MKRTIFACLALSLLGAAFLGVPGAAEAGKGPAQGSHGVLAPPDPPKPRPPDEQGCPANRPFRGSCAQEVTFARNPENGLCCEYPTSCSAPHNWEQFTSRKECEKVE